MGGRKKRFQHRLDISSSMKVILSHFPEHVRAKDLYERLGCYGKILKVVIPPRRNKMGHRYDFARIHLVQDPKRFATILDNMYMDGEKLFVNFQDSTDMSPSKGSGRLSLLNRRLRKCIRRIDSNLRYGGRNPKMVLVMLVLSRTFLLKNRKSKRQGTLTSLLKLHRELLMLVGKAWWGRFFMQGK